MPPRTAATPPSYGGRPGSTPVAAHMRSCRNWQTGTLEVRVFAGSNPAERTCPLVP
jgi:hypothetical protein